MNNFNYDFNDEFNDVVNIDFESPVSTYQMAYDIADDYNITNLMDFIYKVGYLISYIDGEGCLDLQVFNKPNKKLGTKKYYYSRTIISNKSLESLQYLEEFLKCGRIRYVPSGDIYTFTLNDKETEQLINQYGHLFITKKQDASILKRFYQNRAAAPHLKREMQKIKRGVPNEMPAKVLA